MTPSEAVAAVAQYVAAHDVFSEDDVLAALVAAGASAPLAQQAYNFTQTAWAREYLSALRVELSGDFICFTAAGEVVEAGKLEHEPHFQAALELAPQYSGTAGFKRLALLSAEADAVGAALEAGSKPEDLIMAPAFIFLEPPTAAGMANAQRIMNAQVAEIQRQTAPERQAKPWWKFWG